MSGTLLSILLASTLAAPGECHGIDVISDDANNALPIVWDRRWDCVIFPFVDPDDPIVNPSPSLQPLVYYQAIGISEPLWLRRLRSSVELSAPKIVTGQSCLPLATGETVQDQWEIDVATATQVTIVVDVSYPNVDCGLTWGGCTAGLPDPGRGPLDPKLAVYPPGVVPTVGPFDGLFSPACGDAITGETGCSGKPADACILCDNTDCTVPGSTTGSCAELHVVFDQAGIWTIAVTAQARSTDDAAQGCYQLQVTGTELGVLVLTADDTAITF